MIRAIAMNRTEQKEVDEFNEQMKEWVNLYYPGLEESKEEAVKGMADTFQMLFRGADGKPKEIKMEVGSDSPNIQIDNYLDKIKKD